MRHGVTRSSAPPLGWLITLAAASLTGCAIDGTQTGCGCDEVIHGSTPVPTDGAVAPSDAAGTGDVATGDATSDAAIDDATTGDATTGDAGGPG